MNRASATNRHQALGGHEEGDDDDEGPDGQADQDGPPGADPGGHPAEQRGPSERHELDEQEDAEDGRLGELQLLDPVEAGVADDRLDPVVEEQVGEQEEHRLREQAQLLNVSTSCAKLPPTTPRDFSTGGARVPPTWRSPRTGMRVNSPTTDRPTAARSASTSPGPARGWCGTGRARSSARAGCRRRGSRSPSPWTRRGPARPATDPDQQRVVDDEGRPQAEVGDDEEQDAQLPVGAGHEEHRGRGDGAEPGEPGQHPGGPAAAVGDAAHDDEDEDRDDRRDRGGVGEQGPGGDGDPQQAEGRRAPFAVRAGRDRRRRSRPR